MTGLRTPREGCLHTYTVQELHGYYTCKYILFLVSVFELYVFNSVYRIGKHMTGLHTETKRKVYSHVYCTGIPWILYMQMHTSLNR